MRLLDLFCGAGGAAVGYHRAGFKIMGVDVKPQPHYPFDMIRGDVFWFLNKYGVEHFDAIHASPPCQFYSVSRNNGTNANAPDLVPATLARLRELGRPWVCENVPRAPLPSALELCGATFGLGAGGMDLPRHRWFETSWPLMAPPCQHRKGRTLGVYGHGTNAWHRELIGRNITVDEMREAMGIDWMTRAELTQAIPPAFTEYIGHELLAYLERAA